MKYTTSAPIYLQVAASIKEKIITGKILPGEKLPSGRDLALEYAINPNTAARVYQTLEQEHICQTKRGLGTFVSEDKGLIQSLREASAQELLQQFLEGIEKLGISKEEAAQMIERALK